MKENENQFQEGCFKDLDPNSEIECMCSKCQSKRENPLCANCGLNLYEHKEVEGQFLCEDGEGTGEFRPSNQTHPSQRNGSKTDEKKINSDKNYVFHSSGSGESPMEKFPIIPSPEDISNQSPQTKPDRVKSDNSRSNVVDELRETAIRRDKTADTKFPTLSDEAQEIQIPCPENKKGCLVYHCKRIYPEDKVKEFIQLLKEELEVMQFCADHRCSLSLCKEKHHPKYYSVVWTKTLIEIINSLAGERLAGSKEKEI